MTIYREILGFPGYRVGDDGTVWSAWERTAIKGSDGKLMGTAGVITNNWSQILGTDRNGYRMVGLRRGGKTFLRFIHHLVLEAFTGPRPNGTVACHFPDRDPKNNRANNLRWDTQKSNVADKLFHGTHQEGEKHGGHVLTMNDVRRIRSEAKARGDIARLSKELGVNWSTIKRALTGERWRNIALSSDGL